MLKFLGDLNFADWYFDMGNGMGTAISKGLDLFAQLGIDSEDFWIGNFECVCASIPELGYPFVVSPDTLGRIGHLNFYGLANNHVMQAGKGAYEQTVEFLNQHDILFAGTNSRRLAKFEHQNKKVGIIAFSQRPDNFTADPAYWHMPELSEIKAECRRMEDCDFKVAFVHWGYEFMNYPNIDQKLLGHWLIDSGIDLVIGMHPHVAQGYEVYRGKHIFYSLGNSVFNMNWEPTGYGLLVSVDLKSGNINVEHTKSDEHGCPRIVTDVPEKYSLEYLNKQIGISEENEKYFAKARQMTSLYRRANHKAIAKDIICGKSPYAKKMIVDFIRRRIK